MKILLVIICTFIYFSSFSQIGNVQVLIGKYDTYVKKYFDSLNSLKPNPYFKIKKDFSKNGEMVLIAEFATSDQPIFGCYFIMVLFQRTKDGNQICISEKISGEVQYADGNLNYIKDNFTRIPSETAKWEKPFGYDLTFKIIAEFERRDGNYPSYVITYSAKEIDNQP